MFLSKLILILPLLILYDRTSANTGVKRIINGSPATREMFPWQVGISSTGYCCGGSLLSKQWALTAAHCMTMEMEEGGIMRVYLGAIICPNRGPGIQVFETRNMHIHPSYKTDNNLSNDIGLIGWDEEAELGPTVQPIQLPKQGDYVGEGVIVTISGYGLRADKSYSDTRRLEYADVVTIRNEECLSDIPEVSAKILCTHGDDIRGFCNGDSGGPVVKFNSPNPPILVGVISYTFGDCALEDANASVRTEAKLNWIYSVTGLLG